MSLRSKILYIVVVVVALYAAIDNGLLRMKASSFFTDWEISEGKADVELVLAAVDQKVDALDEKARIWASMHQTWEFATQLDAAQRETFIQRELGVAALESAGVDVFYICDAEGKVLWGYVRDPETGQKARLTHSLPAGALDKQSRLLTIKSDTESMSGLMDTELGPLLVSSMPIRDEQGLCFQPSGKSDYHVPKYGNVILGRFVDAALREQIGAAADCEVRIYARESGQLNEKYVDLVAGLTAFEARSLSIPGEDGKLHVFAGLMDFRTRQPLILEAVLDRNITRLGKRAVDYALLSTVGSVLVILFVLLRLLGRFVLGPLSALTRKAVEIGSTDDTTIRVGMQRSDEIGQLASEFDSMLEKLADSRAQVVKTARKAGMSEIATGVLHNVGNVLNSVNVSASLVQKGTEELALKDLDALILVLAEQGDDLAAFITQDARGKHFLPFLKEIAGGLARQRAYISGELATLTAGIDHIADLVRSQQTYAGTKGVFEFACLEDEIEQALRICTQAIGQESGVRLVREFDELPAVKVDKHKLMEIMVNLIQNAHQAMRDTPAAERCLTLRLMAVESGMARLEVEDSGMGISAQNLTKVFHHGFTTKQDGHGFGLHVSANAATEMNASLQVRSAGPGKGTTFFLDLPMQSRELLGAA